MEDQKIYLIWYCYLFFEISFANIRIKYWIIDITLIIGIIGIFDITELKSFWRPCFCLFTVVVISDNPPPLE